MQSAAFDSVDLYLIPCWSTTTNAKNAAVCVKSEQAFNLFDHSNLPNIF